MSAPEFLIKEISVTAQHKAWGSGVARGDSSGTDITWTVKPPLGIEGWTPQEAKMVVLKVRREQQAVIILDAQAKRVPPPDAGMEAIKFYDMVLTGKSGHDDTAENSRNLRQVNGDLREDGFGPESPGTLVHPLQDNGSSGEDAGVKRTLAGDGEVVGSSTEPSSVTGI